MSVKHPIIAITGSSGAGTTTVKKAFEGIFRRGQISSAVVEGDSFHRFNRKEMKEAVVKADAEGRDLSHFGPDANVFKELENLFRDYSNDGAGKRRYYLHNDEEAAPYKQEPGTFTEWADLPENTDLLFYEGLHGGVSDDAEGIDVSRYVDLLIGVVPSVNLEWIQKIHRDVHERGYSTEAVVHTILRRMPDYVNYIVPQFTKTHINFQRVPLVDTSNPFIARDIPTADESMVVIRFNRYRDQDYNYLLNMIHGSFMARPNSLVIPGGKMGFAMEVIFRPIIARMMEDKRKALLGG
ncbi:phosphoribulokinase [Candidatus Venteria ishoeyi]|uniref:Phosphoribulokinase n=1 Tax=Candidatus Venteria ishoeyi TaxID=1899563 RepID=A0A1H6F2K2_9GAMM|nr:phosphoribulokinase [Candidatus Venteria ishoeyi]MDM8546228.1 phosphoribulokinase [Candidatus Venteria ishoeyi]SEH04350.1 Phosphoribulokinase%2C chromosomal [Candidatus Venteria ishoeyi]